MAQLQRDPEPPPPELAPSCAEAGVLGVLPGVIGTLEAVEAVKILLAAGDPRVIAVHFSRNFGHPSAVHAGLARATGDAIIVMDSDLQDPPECIPDMVAAWRDGYDVVAMKRADRSSDTAFKRITAALFYSLLCKLVDIEIPADFHGNVVPQPEFDVRPARAPADPLPPVVVPLPDDDVATIIVDVSS